MVQTLQAFFKKFLTTTIAAAMVVFLFGVGDSFGQDVIHYWNFNNSDSGTPAWPQNHPSDIGDGTITYNFTDDRVQSFAGTTINAVGGDPSGGSFVIQGGSGNVNNGRHFILNISTTDYENIVLSYATQRTSTGFTSQLIEYSTDGTSYSTLTTNTDIPSSFALRTFSFDGIEDVENAENLYIRITLDGADGTTSNNRFDNIRVEGDPLPDDTQVATPEITPDTGTFFEDQTVSITVDGDNKSIFYTTDGNEPTTGSTEYTAPFLVEDGNGPVTVKARAFDDTDTKDPSFIAEVILTFPVNVADIATLRSQSTGSTIYRVTNEATLIGQTDFRNTKFFQDDSDRGIQIDDNGGIITTSYDVGDNVGELVGTLGSFGGQLQFVPSIDFGTAVSTGNTVTPAEVTLDGMTSDHQSRLVVVNNVIFESDGTFPGGGEQLSITDPSIEGFSERYRNVFGDSDITGAPIPASAQNITGIIQENNTGLMLSARTLADFEASPDPALLTSTGSLSGFSYEMGDGPSSSQSFNVSGENLDGTDVSVSAAQDFEVSTDDDSFSASVTLTEFDGTSTQIFVRLKEGLAVDSYSENVTVSGGGASSLVVSVSGEVAPANVVFTETFGVPSSTTDVDDYTGYDNTEFTFTGNTDVRTSLSSSGYTGASGGGNVFFGTASSTIDRNLTISGINVEGLGDFTLSFGMNSGSDQGLTVEYSTDGSNFNEINYTPSSESGWNLETIENITLPPVDDLTLRFSKNDGSSYRLDDVQLLANGFGAQLTGNEGWRMLSLPVGDVAVSNLAGQNLVQGVTGGDAFYDDGGEYENAAPNLHYYLDAVDEENWQEFDNFDSVISSGQGFVWYMFDNDEFNSVPLPFTLAVSGTSPSADVTIPINPSDEFTLIGNPFAGNLDASDVSSWGDLQATARTWDPDTDQYVDTATEAPFTGFFVETAVGGTGNVTIPVAASTSKQMETEQFRIALNLQGINDSEVATSDNSTSILFREGATNEWDIYDATKLVPLLSSYATVGIVGDRAGEERIQAIDSRPIDFSGELDLPLALNVYNFGGEFELSADLINVPEEWSLHLTDNETGETVDLRQSAYTFTYNSSAQKVVAIENKLPETFTMSAEEAVERFTLTIDAETGVNIEEPGTGLPERVALNQNYPNPFNPSTVISYDLPEASDVTIQVYDMTGRQVATLVSSRMEAGSHEITFNAGNLASGVYIYRLQTGEHMLTRKLTLIK